MKRIGLTGGIACGKSTVAGFLQSAGVPVIDADEVAREVVVPRSEGLQAVVAHFGGGVLGSDGTLDRQQLRYRIAQDSNAKAALERILHPLIGQVIKKRLGALEQQGHSLAVVEAALMVETGSYRQYDGMLVVQSNPETQIRRLMARDGMDRAGAQAMLDLQMPVSQKAALADWVVPNEGGLAALKTAVEELLEECPCAARP